MLPGFVSTNEKLTDDPAGSVTLSTTIRPGCTLPKFLLLCVGVVYVMTSGP